MKYIRYKKDNKISYGLLKKDKVIPIKPDPFTNWQKSNEIISLEQVKLLAPCTPSKIIAVGLNYADHAQEMQEKKPSEPVIFMIPSTAVIGPEDNIVYPNTSQRVDYEAELAIVIKKKSKNISIKQAKDSILGYTCANDITARDLQKKDGQWTRAKSFDTFLPLGPVISTDLDPTNTSIKLKLNGEIKQDSNTKNMFYNVYELTSFISQIMTLNPADVIITGTPGGIGPLTTADQVQVIIAGIGKLSNYLTKNN